MQVEIWSDVVCPWCYIGKRRFETALARVSERRDTSAIEVVFRPYQLDPTAQVGRSQPVAVAYAKKFGSTERAQEIFDHVTEVAAGDGLEFHMDLALRANTLLAHRLLRQHLDGTLIKSNESTKYEALSIKSSQREMEAVKAERDSIKFKQVEFMAGKVGSTFAAIITGVTDWGVYVQEQEALCEGMVKLSSIRGDFYEHQATKYQIRGQRTGKVYRLGDSVKVKLVKADADERQLDFEIVAA